jgi:hypothetical protein
MEESKEPIIFTVRLVAHDDSESVKVEVTQRIRVATLIEAYAETKKISAQALRLFVNGARVNAGQTLGDIMDLLQEADNDIYVQLEQTGG